MLQRHYPLLKKTLLAGGLLLSLPATLLHAQACGWLKTAPYKTVPPIKYYDLQCGSGNLVWITGVKTEKAVINFDNITACAPATDPDNYNYFPGVLCKANAGTKIDLTITLNSPLNGNPRAQLWIDWNHNGVFEELPNYTERVPFLGPLSSTPSIFKSVSQKFMFEVPRWAKNGFTRMRIRVSAVGSPPLISGGEFPACGFSKYGECEDYDFEIVNPCLPPAVISVSDITCKSAQVCWSNVENADIYDYHIAPCKEPGCMNPPPNPTPLYAFPLSADLCRTLPNTTYASILPETKYYIVARAICDTFVQGAGSAFWQYSPWDALDSFITLPCCNEPQNLKVANVTENSAIVSWDPVNTAYLYEYSIVTTPNNPPATGTKITGTSLLIGGLSHSKTYYFCVRALCSPTPKSTWICIPFSTAITTSVNSLEKDVQLSAYPNPVKNMLTITVNNQGNRGSISITDITGRLVHTTGMDSDKLEVNTEVWAKGMYILNYNSDNAKAVLKITKD